MAERQDTKASIASAQQLHYRYGTKMRKISIALSLLSAMTLCACGCGPAPQETVQARGASAAVPVAMPSSPSDPLAQRRTTRPPTSPGASAIPQGRGLPSPLPLGAADEAPRINYKQAKKEIDATLKAQPKSFDLRMQAAKFYMRAGDYGSAIPQLEVATRMKPKEVIPWIALGDANALEAHFPAATQAYSRAAALQPNNPQIIRGRGQMYVLQHKWSEAQKILEEGIARYPRDAEIRTVLGNLYLILNKPRKAQAVIEPAIKLEPERADLHYMLGEAYARDLHIEAAILQMRETARLDPNNPEPWGRIGLYENNLARYKDAREPLQRAIELAPNGAHYYWALGDSYLLDSPDPANFERATELYRKALSIQPDNAKALYSFGMALTRRGKPEDLKEASRLFKKLVQLKPTDMNAHFKLAEIYRRMGNSKDAAREQAKFQEIFLKGRQQTRQLNNSVSFRDTAEAHLKLGREAMSEKNYELAVTEFQLALQRDSNLKAAQAGLAQAQRQAALTKKSTP
jgi:Flp pilus assembly protein TadD